MLYSCTHMATVDVKGLIEVVDICHQRTVYMLHLVLGPV